MKKISIKQSYLFLAIGVIFGWTFVLLATWADFEASFYGFARTGASRLNSLDCPILMTRNEKSSFSIKVSNTTDYNASPSVKTQISSPGTPLDSYTSVDLIPGETKQLQWEIGPDNIDLEQFIFARAWIYAAYPMPDRENFCGVLVLDLPISGKAITSLMVLISLLGIAFGLYGLYQNSQRRLMNSVDFVGLTVLGFMILVGMLSAFFGIWVLGVLTLFLSLIFVVIFVSHIIREM